MQLFFSLNVGRDDFLKYYQGVTQKVEVKDYDGRVLYINAKYFRPYILENGIHGRFCLQLAADGSFEKLDKIG